MQKAGQSSHGDKIRKSNEGDEEPNDDEMIALVTAVVVMKTLHSLQNISLSDSLNRLLSEAPGI